MKKIMEAMRTSSLFSGCSGRLLTQLSSAPDLKVREYQKDEFVLHQGQMPKGIGLVVSGKLRILRDDCMGSREILAEVGTGEIFDEVYGILTDEPQRVAVAAAENSTAAFFTLEGILAAGRAEPVLMENLLRVLARKNLFLTTKMAHLSKRSIRAKVISYLSEMSERQKPEAARGSLRNGARDKITISIPFNRQQLADYLAVDRAALSRELSRMKKEGLITYHKNQFVLLQPLGSEDR